MKSIPVGLRTLRCLCQTIVSLLQNQQLHLKFQTQAIIFGELSPIIAIHGGQGTLSYRKSRSCLCVPFPSEWTETHSEWTKNQCEWTKTHSEWTVIQVKWTETHSEWTKNPPPISKVSLQEKR